MRQIVWTSTIGSLADGISRANPGSDALKPLVFDHAQLVRQTESDALKPLVFIDSELGAQTDLTL